MAINCRDGGRECLVGDGDACPCDLPEPARDDADGGHAADRRQPQYAGDDAARHDATGHGNSDAHTDADADPNTYSDTHANTNTNTYAHPHPARRWSAR